MSATISKQATGDLTMVGTPQATVTVLFRNSLNKVLFCTGTVMPPDAGTIYAKGCLFIDTDVATGTSGLYVNVGTSASCVFKLVTNAA